MAVAGDRLSGTVGEEAAEDPVQMGVGDSRSFVVDAHGGGVVFAFRG